MKTGNSRRERVRVRTRRCRIQIATLTVLFMAGLFTVAEAQQQAPPLTVVNVLELLRSGMPEARILQTIVEACVIQGGDAAVQSQLEQAGASVALRRTSEAFTCPEVVTVARVEINAVPTILVEGQTHRLGVSVLDQDGAEVRDRPVRWSSTDPSVVSITSEGEIRGVGPGASQIRAEVDAIVGEVRLIVRGLPAVIEVDTEALTLYVGDQRTLQASVLDRAGNRLVTNLEWFMADPRIASVDGGVIRARAAGETRLGISAGSNLRQSVLVVVRMARPAPPTARAVAGAEPPRPRAEVIRDLEARIRWAEAYRGGENRRESFGWGSSILPLLGGVAAGVYVASSDSDASTGKRVAGFIGGFAVTSMTAAGLVGGLLTLAGVRPGFNPSQESTDAQFRRACGPQATISSREICLADLREQLARERRRGADTSGY